jgi:hypothetical protein
MSVPSGALGNVLGAREALDASAAGAIDFMGLPRMPGAFVFSPDAAIVCYEAPGDPARAFMFYARVFDDRGWRESREDGLRFVSPLFATACYEKSDYSLVFSARPTPRKKATVTVTLQQMGTLDTRTLPRQRDATVIWSARISTTYRTAANVREAADFTRNALADLGWNDYALVESRHDLRHENQTFQFAKDGMSLTVRASRALTRWKGTLVQYSASMAAPRTTRSRPVSVNHDDSLAGRQIAVERA